MTNKEMLFWFSIAVLLFCAVAVASGSFVAKELVKTEAERRRIENAPKELTAQIK